MNISEDANGNSCCDTTDEGDDDDHGIGERNVDGNATVDERVTDAKVVESVSKEAEDKAVASVVEKIKKGLKEMFPIKKRGQLQVQVSTDVAINKDLHILPDFNGHIAQAEGTLEERSLRLETFFKNQSKNTIRSAQGIAWKSSFIAACLRHIRDSSSQASEPTVRWVLVVRMVNSIVDGLWSSWGPKAALVYEALASTSDAPSLDAAINLFPGKNYNLSNIVKRSESIKKNVVQRVIDTLEMTVPDVPSATPVFHPAGLISYALNIK